MIDSDRVDLDAESCILLLHDIKTPGDWILREPSFGCWTRVFGWLGHGARLEPPTNKGAVFYCQNDEKDQATIVVKQQMDTNNAWSDALDGAVS